MMKHVVRLLVCAFLLGAATSSRASGLALGPKIGTLGPGLELTGYLTDNLNFRIAGNYVAFSITGEEDDIEYDGDVRFASVLGLLDWFPADNNFRITAGVTLNNNEIEMTGDTSEPTEINDTEYTPAQIGRLTGDATFDEVVPYFGIGFGNPLWDESEQSWSFMFDLGVIFQGTADVELEADGTLANDPSFQADLQEEEDDAQDFADDIKIYPVLSFGVTYYFW